MHRNATLFLLLLLLFHHASAASFGELRVIQNSGETLVLEYVAPQQISDVEPLERLFRDLPSQPQGLQALTTNALVILPPHGNPELRMEVQSALHLEAPRIPAWENISESFARLVDIGWWRGFRLGRLEIQPLARDRDQVQWIRSARLEIRYGAEIAARSGAASTLSPAEQRFLGKILNPDMPSGWRIEPQARKTAATGDIVAEPAIKVFIEQSGMVALTYERLQDFGLVDGTPASQNFHVLHRGSELPLYYFGDADSLFEMGEAIWFYGEALHGDSTWFHDESRYNVYWVTRDERPSRRWQVVASALVDLNRAPESFFEWVHLEDDESYYHGDTDADIYTTGPVAGEGWIWKRLVAGDSLVVSTTIQGLHEEAGPCSLRVRLRGITRSSIRPNHHIRVFINGYIVIDKTFSDNQEVRPDTVFPVAFLREGTNRIVIRSVGDTGAPIDQLYVDWIDLGYWRRFMAPEGRLLFEADTQPGEKLSIRVDGLPDSTVFCVRSDRREGVSRRHARTGLLGLGAALCQ